MSHSSSSCSSRRFPGGGDDQAQLIRRVNKVGEEAKVWMERIRLLRGVIGLQVDVGGAVAVGLNISVNGFFNDRLQRCPILHIHLLLDTPHDQAGDHR